MYAPDLPGFGETEAPWEADHSHLALAEECASILQELGAAPVHLVGHSMGAKVAAWLAVKHPDLIRTLTLVDPALYGAPMKVLSKVPGLPALACWVLSQRWSRQERFVNDLARFYNGPVSDDVTADYWRRYQRKRNQRGAVAHLRDGGGPSVVPYLGQVRVPIHIIWGEQDTLFPPSQAESLAKAFSGCLGKPAVSILPNADHFPMETRPELFNQALVGFLHRHGARTNAG